MWQKYRMEKNYFIEVRTYKSTNKMGLELGEFVEQEFNHKVIDEENFESVVINTIKEKMAILESKYPRCKPFRYVQYNHSDLYKKESPNIYVKPESTFNDNVIFSLDTTVIRNKVNVESFLNL